LPQGGDAVMGSFALELGEFFFDIDFFCANAGEPELFRTDIGT
jgi:hypothetical protein